MNLCPDWEQWMQMGGSQCNDDKNDNDDNDNVNSNSKDNNNDKDNTDSL